MQPIPEDADLPEDVGEDEDFLMNLHEILCSRHVVEGAMVCNNCSREYPINNGVANMLLNEDEV